MMTWEAYEPAHISVLCRIYRNRGLTHKPCMGTCDGHGTGQLCDEQCGCECHQHGPQGAPYERD